MMSFAFSLYLLRFVYNTTKTRRFRVRLAGFMNQKMFSLDIKWPILFYLSFAVHVSLLLSLSHSLLLVYLFAVCVLSHLSVIVVCLYVVPFSCDLLRSFQSLSAFISLSFFSQLVLWLFSHSRLRHATEAAWSLNISFDKFALNPLWNAQ